MSIALQIVMLLCFLVGSCYIGLCFHVQTVVMRLWFWCCASMRPVLCFFFNEIVQTRQYGFSVFSSVMAISRVTIGFKWFINPYLLGCLPEESIMRGSKRLPTYTETKMSSFWRNFHHWLHWKLSFWQLPVQPVMNISSKWRLFRFSVDKCHLDPLLYGCHGINKSTSSHATHSDREWWGEYRPINFTLYRH